MHLIPIYLCLSLNHLQFYYLKLLCTFHNSDLDQFAFDEDNAAAADECDDNSNDSAMDPIVAAI